MIQKNKLKNTIIAFIFLSFQYINAQITLTNNIGTTLIKTDMYSCDESETWSRVFKLSDFGIAPNEQFIIKSGQVGLSKSDVGAKLSFSVYTIDSTFPVFFYSSFPRTVLGTRGSKQSPLINGAPEIVQIDFDEPIVVPAGTQRILVTVNKYKEVYNTSSSEVFIAGTEHDTGESWYLGCDKEHALSPTTDLTIPVPNANFYINVTGDVFDTKSSGLITRLSHNVCDDVIETDIHSCSSSNIYWARAFTLKDFGISNNEEFVIKSGQVGINKTSWGADVGFNIYKIDDNFPASFSKTDLIGSSQRKGLQYNIGPESQIVEVNFDTPIVIPAGVKRILVEVHKGIDGGEGTAFIAGSQQDNDVSWQRGCTMLPGGPDFGDKYVSTADFGKPNANFYINVTGNVKHVSNKFEMNFSNICTEFLKEFSIDNPSEIASVEWNFGDPASGAANTSNDLSPFHDFSVDGKYAITATVRGKDGTVEILTETIDAKEPPKAYGINNIYGCESNFNTGISASFDTSIITQQVLGGQTDKIVTFIDGKGTKYSTLPNPFTNTIKNRETITVRVSHKGNFCCYSETTFDLIVNPLPELATISNLSLCDDDNDGFAMFNLQQVETLIIGTAHNIKVEFYHQDGQRIQTPLNAVKNLVINEEVIKVKVINSNTNCYNETTFKLVVNPLPKANLLDEIIGCDDNNDGISEYFDTSKVETNVLGHQIGMKVSYFNASGIPLPSPLPNPYTNTTKNEELITVRVTNTLTSCYTETKLVLKTASQPRIKKPSNKYSCDEGGGFAFFEMSDLQTEIIGNQLGLKVTYFDNNGNQLASPLPVLFKNTQAWSQTILVRVENEINKLCYSETSFDLFVNSLPTVNIQKTYFLCNLEPSLKITVDNNWDNYTWKSQDNVIVSNIAEANLENAGKYTLTIGKTKNDIYCENSFDFELIRSVLPKIKEVKYKELSDNNFIEIVSAVMGNYEYSIDGMNYQESNYFANIPGKTYTVYLRDKEGCGQDLKEVTLIDYPKFFTPNNDGFNDFWRIIGVEKYPNSKIVIFDRYGKVLKELSSNDYGWDGLYNGNELLADDYWFTANLSDKLVFSGHFSLKR
ncbi:conserved protein of unknown function precursor containing a type B C-terminal secretion signal [Flavobacterium collinsii]|uniref:PKD domain-containing protein n=1 Tax=Flavobacterium collinsii TaxID=1114861 RepID=A0A9W4THR8_9FLAO|nr:conserved protein of unknown function precursor containing a type B C-terminal secretion signal [Flavobacterium collinsii]